MTWIFFSCSLKSNFIDIRFLRGSAPLPFVDQLSEFFKGRSLVPIKSPVIYGDEATPLWNFYYPIFLQMGSVRCTFFAYVNDIALKPNLLDFKKKGN